MRNITKKMMSALLILSLLLSCTDFAQAKAAIRLSKRIVNLKASSIVEIGTNATLVTFEYPAEMGFEMDSVKAMTQDTSVASTYFPASNRTFFAFGGNMTTGEYIGVEVNKSKLKKGAVFTHSDLAKESEKEDGDCKLILNNTFRAKAGDHTNLYPSSDIVEDAEIKKRLSASAYPKVRKYL